MNKSDFLLEKMERKFANRKYGVDRLSERTIKAYRYDLDSFLSFMKRRNKKKASDIDRDDIEAFLASIPRSKDESTANYNRKLSSLRSFFRFLEKHGLKKNPVDEFKPIKNNVRQISYLTEVERQKLVKTIKEKASPFYKARDLAIISLFLNVGVRVSELANLGMNDIE